MSDAFYFACLGATTVMAIIVPLVIRRGIQRPESSTKMAVCAGFGAAIGFVCSLPFRRTLEMPWFPYITEAYFGGLILTLLFYRAYRSAQPRATLPDRV